MRVLFVLPHPIEGPSSRFRVYQYIPYLEQHGVECTVRPFLDSDKIHELYKDGNTGRKIALTLGGLSGRMGDIGRARRHDIVFILREAFYIGGELGEGVETSACSTWVALASASVAATSTLAMASPSFTNAP